MFGQGIETLEEPGACYAQLHSWILIVSTSYGFHGGGGSGLFGKNRRNCGKYVILGNPITVLDRQRQ
uniref:Uncharacterized protein n=1 Tax=Kalanchoe fedtschenkoi TaxID=63787 RepID=A0A7N0UPW7_KALFE